MNHRCIDQSITYLNDIFLIILKWIEWLFNYLTYVYLDRDKLWKFFDFI